MKHLLVVEDSESFYSLIKRAIEDVSVDWARSGKEAITIYRKKRPDLVLVDILLPDMNGVEVIRELKKYDKDAKIIAVSGIDHNELTKEVLEEGAIDFLNKTSGIAYLRRKIRENIEE